MKEETRGRKALPYKTFRKRYPVPLMKEFDERAKEWKKEKGYD